MKYFLQSSTGRHFEVEVEPLAEGGFRVLLDGREIEADFADVDRLGQYAARLDQKSYAVSIEERSETDLHVNIAGESFRMSALDQRERDAGAVGGARKSRSETVTAAIPGIVVEVKAAVGEVVEAGVPLVVLEAMKMQNEIGSAQGGIVKEVLVEAQQTVAMGQPLLKLDPLPDESAEAD